MRSTVSRPVVMTKEAAPRGCVPIAASSSAIGATARRAGRALLPLARELARRYHGRGEPLEAPRAVASVGLLKAIDRVDPTARPRSPRSPCPPSSVSCGAISATGAGRCATRRSSRCAYSARPTSSRTRTPARPTVEEIARHLGSSCELVLEAREAAGAHRALSLEEPVDHDGAESPLARSIGAEDPGSDRAAADGI
jgi:RNA polymerase sigma-B factor